MDDGRLVIYCLVPERLKDDLLGDLRAHYARDDRVHVIVDHRKGERRASARGGLPSRSAEEDREDRRTGRDRRRPVLPRWFDQLPPELARRAEGVQFVQRMLPVSGAPDRRQRRGDRGRGAHRQPRGAHRALLARLRARALAPVRAARRRRLGRPGAPDRLRPHPRRARGRPVRPARVRPRCSTRRSTPPSPPTPDDCRTTRPATEPVLAITDPTLDEIVAVAERDPRWFQRGLNERDKILRLAARARDRGRAHRLHRRARHRRPPDHRRAGRRRRRCRSRPALRKVAAGDGLRALRRRRHARPRLLPPARRAPSTTCTSSSTTGRCGATRSTCASTCAATPTRRPAGPVAKREAARAGGHSLIAYARAARARPCARSSARAALSSQRAA